MDFLINRFGTDVYNTIKQLIVSVINKLGIPYDIGQLEHNVQELNNTVGHNSTDIIRLQQDLYKATKIALLYIGTGETFDEVIADETKYENFELWSELEITFDESPLFIVMPTNITTNIVATISGVEIPFTETEETYNETTYRVLTSNEDLDGSLKIKISK